MNARPKKKLCWNCEGSVVITEDNCPYCGVYLHPGTLNGETEKTSLFSSSYSNEVLEQEEDPQQLETSQEQAASFSSFEEKEKIPDVKQLLLTWVYLTSGLIFSLFAFVLLTFSKEGFFTLQWSQENGWLFILTGIPLLILGYRSLKNLD